MNCKTLSNRYQPFHCSDSGHSAGISAAALPRCVHLIKKLSRGQHSRKVCRQQLGNPSESLLLALVLASVLQRCMSMLRDRFFLQQ